MSSPSHTSADDRKRTYRHLAHSHLVHSFTVSVKETDLAIHASAELKNTAGELVLSLREQIETFIRMHPDFATTLHPFPFSGPAPEIIRKMISAGELAGVGPMAAVAGAVAEMVGNGLLLLTEEVIIENGGDVFIKSEKPVTVGIYAGSSPVSMNLGIHVNARKAQVGVCTSSGTIGHSFSTGEADAVCVVSNSCFIADAAATAIGNRVKTKKDFSNAMEFGKKIQEVRGIVIIRKDRIAAWGDIELVPLG